MSNKLDSTDLYCPGCHAKSVVQVPGGWYVCESCRKSFEASAERVEELKNVPSEKEEDRNEPRERPWYVRTSLYLMYGLLGILAVIVALIVIPVVLFYGNVYLFVGIFLPFYWYDAPSGTPLMTVLASTYDMVHGILLVIHCLFWFIFISASISQGWWSGVIAAGIRNSRD